MKLTIVIDESKEEEILATVHGPSVFTEKLKALVTDHSEAGLVADHSEVGLVTAYREEDMVLLAYEQIECITVLEGKTWAIDVKGRRYRLKQRLYELEQCLPGHFIRLNKSAIGNERRLERFTAAFSGAVDAVFKCGYREYVSRRCFAAIKRRYHQ